VKRQQAPLGNHQIGQTEKGVQLRRILGQPAVAELPEVEQVLDEVERGLDLGADTGLDGFQFAQQLADQRVLRDSLELAALHGDLPVIDPFLQIILLFIDGRRFRQQ